MINPGYAELHCHSYFSLLDGAASPRALIDRAASLGMTAVALTDHDNVYGAVEFAAAAKLAGIKPLFGAELTLSSGHHLTLLAENDAGWRNLCQLISHAQFEAPKGEAALDPRLLGDHAAGLICLTGCRRGPVMSALATGDHRRARRATEWLVSRFGPERTVIELQHHLARGAARLVREGVALATTLGLTYVATNNVHYPEASDHRLHDVLRCIKHKASLDEAAPLLYPNAEYFLKSGPDLRPLFADFPDALATSIRLAQRCEVSLPTGAQALPTYPTPEGVSAFEYLKQLCEHALLGRYGGHMEGPRAQLEKELTLIEQRDLANYFLIVWDVIAWSRAHGIRCQGRGSAANSIVAYLLAISNIDPLEHNLTFERFLSPERTVPPDIDIDFATDRREEVIHYLYRTYGPEHVAMASTVITMQARGALRDAAKALGIPKPLVKPVTTLLDGRGAAAVATSPELAERAEAGETWQQLQEIAQRLVGIPRHLGLHNGGMVLAASPLATWIPTEPAAMAGRTVVQWDKEAMEDQGLIKLDILGLRMLAALTDAVDWIEETSEARIDLDALDLSDPAVYQMIAQADTIGVFQVESRAQSNILPRLQPRCFDDLVVAISLVRPGPLIGNMTHPYLRRRTAIESVSYPHPRLKPVLESTLGVILFQEQVLQVVEALSGLPLGVGEQIRRCLGKPHRAAQLERLHQRFRDGARARGVSSELCTEIWDALRAFGGYSFPRAHAVSFALTVYQSAWLKHYHHGAFTVGLLNHQPMGFWPPATLVSDAQRHGVTVLPVDIHLSGTRCQLISENRLRLGLNFIKGLGEAGATRLVDARKRAPLESLEALCRRTHLPRRLVEHLIQAGACDRWNVPRRRLLWELAALRYDERELDIQAIPDEVQPPALTEAETWGWEQTWGLSARPHLMSHWRSKLQGVGYVCSDALRSVPSGTQVRTAGQLIIHQAPPTAKQVRFLTLEDEAGLINIIVRAEVYERYRRAIRGSALLQVEGIVQQRHGNTNVIAQRVEPLTSEQGHRPGTLPER